MILVAALMNGFGHGSDVTTAMFGVGATLLPTAPSGLLRRQAGTTGTLIPDTLNAVMAGASIAAGQVAPAPVPLPPLPPTG